MGRCPLCSDRSAKRFCPAKETSICAVCCGTKREVEIDCPSSCPHLKLGRLYEAEKRTPDPQLMARVQSFDDNFVERYSPVFDAVGLAVLAERAAAPWLVDSDVLEVFKALSATMKTLSSGIYYESVPDLPIRASLFRRLKEVFDEFMRSQIDVHRQLTLRVSEASQILDFLTFVATMNSNARPRSRQYLDWLATFTGRTANPTEQSSRLIVP
jgi:hypothetical protein